MSLADVDFIDYGAEPEGTAGAGNEEAPRLVVELQRSFDLWERSWPDLPLAALWLHAGDDSASLAPRLQQALGQRVLVLDPERALPGFYAAATTPALRAALLPLLGAALRDDARRL